MKLGQKVLVFRKEAMCILDKVFISVHYHSRDEQKKKVLNSHFSCHLGCVAAMFKLNLTSNVQLMNPPLIIYNGSK